MQSDALPLWQLPPDRTHKFFCLVQPDPERQTNTERLVKQPTPHQRRRFPRVGDCDVILARPVPDRLRSRLRLQRPDLIRRNPECTERIDAHSECEWKQGINVTDVPIGTLLACGSEPSSHWSPDAVEGSRQGASPPSRLDSIPRRQTPCSHATTALSAAALCILPPHTHSAVGGEPPATSGVSPPLTSCGLLMEG